MFVPHSIAVFSINVSRTLTGKAGWTQKNFLFNYNYSKNKKEKKINSISSFKRRRNSNEVDMNHESLCIFEIFIGAVNN